MPLADASPFRELLSLHLPTSDYAIAGSGPLFARRLIRSVGDLDVVARGEAWRRAAALGPVEEAPEAGVHRVVLFDGLVEVLDGWYPQVWDVDELIDGAEIIDGIRFVPLPVVEWTKSRSRRAKDREHLRLLAAATPARVAG
jgi:hypothetical protein